MFFLPKASAIYFASHITDTVSERLRRWTRNPLGSARRGSNPLGVALCARWQRNVIRSLACIYKWPSVQTLAYARVFAHAKRARTSSAPWMLQNRKPYKFVYDILDGQILTHGAQRLQIFSHQEYFRYEKSILCSTNNAPPAGLEPAIFGLEVRRLVH